MVTSRAEQLNVPQELLINAIEFARLCADGVYYLSRKWGATRVQIATRPPALILEMGALWYIEWINQIAAESGVEDPDLPNSQEAEADLLDRIQNDPESFATTEGAILSRQMFKFQMNNVTWALPTDGSATLPQLYLMPDESPEDLDNLLEQLAQIICNSDSANQGEIN